MPLRQIFERRGAAAVVGAKSSEVNHNGYAHGDSNLPVLNVKALQVVDDRGEVRIQLACTPEGQAQVSIMSTDGETRIGLVVDRSNGPSVILRDHAQNRIQLLVDRSGMATGILLSDPAGHFAPWDLEDHPGVRDLLCELGHQGALSRDAHLRLLAERCGVALATLQEAAREFAQTAETES